MVERLGDEQLVYCQTEANQFICKIDSHFEIDYDTEYYFSMDLEKVHIFDANDDNITTRILNP